MRRHIDALDDVLVPLLVTRGGYMTQAARIKIDANQVRDEERIEGHRGARAPVPPRKAASLTSSRPSTAA